MKMRTAIAALAAAVAFPVLAADAPSAPPAPRTPRVPAPPPPDFNFSFDLDVGDLLAQADVARDHAEHMRDWADNLAAEVQGSMAMVFSDRVGRGKLVKGAPYSAEVITETNQTLGDGNVISHKRTSRVYRDGEGRTRQETLRGDTVRSIYIYDPAAEMSYTLIPGSKLAIGVHKRAPRVRIEKMSGDGKEVRVEKTIVVKQLDDLDRELKSEGPNTRKEVRVQVFRVGDGDVTSADAPVAPIPPMPPTPPNAPGAAPMPPMPPMPSMPPMPGTMLHDLGGLGKGTTTSLGSKTFDGVKAEGKQTTWTIPAGQVGNRAPINVTSESWYSPELQVTVYTRHNDPRTGESIYRLASIKRGEPSADLFKVPADYKLRGRGRTSADAPDAQRERR